MLSRCKAVSILVVTLFFLKALHFLLTYTASSPSMVQPKSINMYGDSIGSALSTSSPLTSSITTEELSVQGEKSYSFMGVEQRGKFQQSEVEKFCLTYNRLVSEYGDSEIEVFPKRQMLLSDRTKTLYCYVPKVGCTTQKVLLFLSLNVFPPSLIKNKTRSPGEGYVELGVKKHSFIVKLEEEQNEILQTYFKYMMYRNPVERLVSGYLSKIYTLPLIGFKQSEPERNWLRTAIYKYTHPKEYATWRTEGGTVPITINFTDFIDYWLINDGIRIDEHFKPAFELCRPCLVKYDYYANFNAFYDEVAFFSDRIQGNLSHLLNAKKRKEGSTESIALEYYREISDTKKLKIIEMMAVDLNFYYAIFPAERGSHKKIMGVDFDVPPLESAFNQDNEHQLDSFYN